MGAKHPDFEEIMEQTPATRKHEALRQILARNNRCKIFIGGSENDRFDYPYRLVPVDRVTERTRRAATELMVDSAIGDPSIKNEEIINTVIEYDAQYVIPKDFYGDPKRTHESFTSFLDYYDDSGCTATIIVPIQPPHGKHFEVYEDCYRQFSHFAVGGVKDQPPEKQLEAVRTARDAVGDYAHLHGLGMAGSERLIDALWTDPGLLDSLDASTFERLAGWGKVADKTWAQHSLPDIATPNGEDIFTLNAILSEWMVYLLNYQLASLVDRDSPTAPVAPDDDAPATSQPHGDQATLTDTWTSSDDLQTDGGTNSSQ